MSLLRLGSHLCETDETHTFAPQAIFPRGTAAFTLVAPTDDPDDLGAVTFSANVPCVRIEGAPVANEAGGDFWTGTTGEPPQFVVASTDACPSTAWLPRCDRDDLKRLSARHLYMAGANVVGQTYMPATAAGPWRRQPPQGDKDKLTQRMAEARRVFGSDILMPPAVRLADLAGADARETASRQARIAAELVDQATKTKRVRSRHSPYLDSCNVSQSSDDNDEGAISGAAHDAELWHSGPWANKARPRNLTGCEETFFGASLRAVRCAAGLARLPDGDDEAVVASSKSFDADGDDNAADDGMYPLVTVAPVQPSAQCDTVLKKRGCHYALFVDGMPAAAAWRERCAASRARRADALRHRKSRRNLAVNAFREMLRDRRLNGRDGAEVWAALAAEDKLAYRRQAEERLEAFLNAP
jgi:hypothetical protein